MPSILLVVALKTSKVLRNLFYTRSILVSEVTHFIFTSAFSEWFAFIGQKAPPGFPGSPYAINFKSSTPGLSAMAPMNVSTYSCGDTSLGCSCGDCPSSPACSSPEPLPPPHQEDSCSFRIGPLKVSLINFVA